MGAYIRLSPSDEIREEGSLVSHPQRIKDFVKFKCAQEDGWGEIIETYVDKDLSGKDFNRPAFRRMCKDIRDGKINAVIVTELSRLSRNVKDFCQFKDFLTEHKAKFFSLKENFDTSTPVGELMVLQCISFAQFERSSIVTRIKEGAKARAMRGLSNGGQRSLGYDPDPNRSCHIVVNENEKPIVEFIFRKYLELGSLRELQVFLNANGYKTKEFVTRSGNRVGGKQWMFTSLNNLLTNCIYIGKREIHKKNRSKRRDEVAEGEEYKLVNAQWPAIIPEDLFYRVQSLLESNKNRTRRYVHHYRLSGLVWCGVCGSKLTGKAGTGRNGKYFYYGHMRKMTLIDDRHLKKCSLELVSAPLLEEAMIDRLSDLARDKALLLSLIKNSGTSSKSKLDYLDSLIASKDQAHKQMVKQRDGLLQAVGDAPGERSKKALLQKIEDLGEQLDMLLNEKESLKQDRKNLASTVINLEDAFSMIKDFRKEFRERSAREQHELLKNAIKRVTIKENGITAEYFGSPREDLLPGGSPEIFISNKVSDRFDSRNKEPAADYPRAPVRSLYNLVETVGVEPTSESLPPLESTCVVFVLD